LLEWRYIIGAVRHDGKIVASPTTAICDVGDAPRGCPERLLVRRRERAQRTDPRRQARWWAKRTMIWLLIGLALAVALVLGASLTLLLMVAAVLTLVLVPLLLFGIRVLFWIFLGVLLVFTVVESEHTATLWFIGLGLVASLIVVLDGNRTHMMPMPASPQIGEPPPRRRRRPRARAAEASSAGDTGRTVPGEALPFDQARMAPAPVPPLPVAAAQAAARESIDLPRHDQETWPFEEQAPGGAGAGIRALGRAAGSLLSPRRRRIEMNR
jgi:hypothetical protein